MAESPLLPFRTIAMSKLLIKKSWNQSKSIFVVPKRSWNSQNCRIFRAKIQFCHSESFTNLSLVATRRSAHLWLVGIDFSLVRYFTILGFSDGRIVKSMKNTNTKVTCTTSADQCGPHLADSAQADYHSACRFPLLYSSVHLSAGSKRNWVTKLSSMPLGTLGTTMKNTNTKLDCTTSADQCGPPMYASR
jgi:hypothetical protein